MAETATRAKRRSGVFNITVMVAQPLGRIPRCADFPRVLPEKMPGTRPVGRDGCQAPLRCAMSPSAGEDVRAGPGFGDAVPRALGVGLVVEWTQSNSPQLVEPFEDDRLFTC